MRSIKLGAPASCRLFWGANDLRQQDAAPQGGLRGDER
jgi:hypothetical protein